jgi:hypothetical protein
MTAVQVPYSELVRCSSAPPLRDADLEQMTVDEIELLLRMRLQAFASRGHAWQQALLLAINPDAA